MELLIPHECHYCGLVDEAKFIYAGPHIKQVCNGCNRYVKFFSKYQVPDVKEIKLKIWSITTDIDKINESKKIVGFNPDCSKSKIDESLDYWRLYLYFRSSKMKEASE